MVLVTIKRVVGMKLHFHKGEGRMHVNNEKSRSSNNKF